jgi:hypothetical protein
MENNDLRTVYESGSSAWGWSSESSRSNRLAHGVKEELRLLEELPMRVCPDLVLLMGIKAIL